MPTYEYECEDCGHKFELFQNMSESPCQECPKCAGKLRRPIKGGTGVIIKGKGCNGRFRDRQEPCENYCHENNPCCGQEGLYDKSFCRQKS